MTESLSRRQDASTWGAAPYESKLRTMHVGVGALREKWLSTASAHPSYFSMHYNSLFRTVHPTEVQTFLNFLQPETVPEFHFVRPADRRQRGQRHKAGQTLISVCTWRGQLLGRHLGDTSHTDIWERLTSSRREMHPSVITVLLL
eukprot:1177535-Prorocentrum_minimum.AAC.6